MYVIEREGAGGARENTHECNLFCDDSTDHGDNDTTIKDTKQRTTATTEFGPCCDNEKSILRLET
jgi:hypothetical protein